MKKINKVVLVVFSVIILILGVFINLLAVKLMNINTMFSLLEQALTTNPASKIILIATEICMCFAILAIFLDTSDKKETKERKDILMQNDNGKLMISKETIENLVNGVVSKFAGVKESKTRIFTDAQNNVAVLVELTVIEELVIKTLTLELQNQIKEAIKKTSDLEVKEVNVRIKNIVKNSANTQEI